VAGCLGFAFDIFCVTALSFLASQSLMVLNCWHCQVLLHFFDWRWIKNNPKRLKIKHVQFFEDFFCVDETVKFIPVLCSTITDIEHFSYRKAYIVCTYRWNTYCRNAHRVHLALWVNCCKLAISITKAGFALESNIQ